MLLKVIIEKPLQESVAAFETAISRRGFGVVGKFDFQKTMAQKGVVFSHACVVVEVCNPQKAKVVLEKNMSIATALPCRVAFYEQEGQTVIATMTPTAILDLFNEPDLNPVAQEIEDVIKQAMLDCKK